MDSPQNPALDQDYSSYIRFTPYQLLTELSATHTVIANLHIRIGFLRQEELRQVSHAKGQRLEYEALRDAYIEKKWLLKTLLDHLDISSDSSHGE